MPAVEFPPGITSLLSKTAKIANWSDGNLVRWDDGVTLRPVNGWERVVYPTEFASRCRAVHKWIAHNGVLWTAYLCEQHVYVDTGSSLTDITPAGGMAPLGGVEAGYGELNFNLSTYGTPRPGLSTLQKFSPAWSMNNWGEDLLVMTSYDGRLLRWKTSTPGAVLEVVPGAPTQNRQFVVTPEHHVMLFQMGGNLADFGWCSEEDIEDWDFGNPFNTAGMYTLDPYSPIISAHSSAIGVLAHTPAMMHFIEYLGLPYIYRYRAVAKTPIPISAASMSSIPEGIMWISVEGFWLFNGNTANTIACPIWDTISTKMDFQRTVRESHSVNLLARGEIWWFWVDPTISLECTRYVAFDYRSKVWMPGYLKRTCGVTFANDKFPLMSDGWKVWKHETGFTYPEALYLPYLESQTINIAGGEIWNTIADIIPEVTGDRTALAFSLAMNNDRSTNNVTYSPKRVINEHGKVDIRETARDVRLRIDMVKNSDWQTVGPILFNIKARGKKK